MTRENPDNCGMCVQTPFSAADDAAAAGAGTKASWAVDPARGIHGSLKKLTHGSDVWAGAPHLVPIRRIGAAHIDDIQTHLLALDPQDRYLRFGYAAGDEQICRYVNGLNFQRDELFGIFNRRLELLAIAHLAFMPEAKRAEFGVSVSRHARGRGYGGRLFDRAVMHARNNRVDEIFIHALSENAVMLRIARNAGATMVRDGSESEAHLQLPPADMQSWATELISEQMALANYQAKAHSKQFWDMLKLIPGMGSIHRN